jgi:broad specificity phosphatase PhoE
MAIQRVFIVRHGETDYNLTGRWQGNLDIPLNKAGREQAKHVAKIFADLSIGAIYSSDLSRAYETAYPIAQQISLSIQKDKRLQEIRLGIFQGLNRAEIAKTYPLEHNYWQNDDNYAPAGGGESRIQMQARMYEFWSELITNETAENVVVVSHGGSIRWLLVRIFGLDAVMGKHFENTSVTTLEKTEQGWTLVKIADVAHLENVSVLGDKKDTSYNLGKHF